ncbi:MAG TPA: hypothetical protein VG388_02390 [Solirubrobacteraceae bacterium]|jgi:hypothetical protein|nr:hypothetical protein [Solirubrobacteraceae bacterium]
MRQRHRAPGIDHRPAETVKGLEHLTEEWVILLRWLTGARVEFVVVGPAGEAIRGRAGTEGALAITPAPYDRNLDRLARALMAGHAGLRTGGAGTSPMRFTAAALAAEERWTLRCEGPYDLDLEISPAARYSELLYDAGRFEIEAGVNVEVASVEDLERHAHALRTGEEPEIRITRGPVVPQNSSN